MVCDIFQKEAKQKGVLSVNVHDSIRVGPPIKWKPHSADKLNHLIIRDDPIRNNPNDLKKMRYIIDDCTLPKGAYLGRWHNWNLYEYIMNGISKEIQLGFNPLTLLPHCPFKETIE